MGGEWTGKSVMCPTVNFCSLMPVVEGPKGEVLGRLLSNTVLHLSFSYISLTCYV